MYDFGGPTLSMKGERRAVTANKDREEGKNGPSWVAARQMALLPRDDTHFAQGVPQGIQSKGCTFIGQFRPFMAESTAAALMFTLSYTKTSQRIEICDAVMVPSDPLKVGLLH